MSEIPPRGEIPRGHEWNIPSTGESVKEPSCDPRPTGCPPSWLISHRSQVLRAHGPLAAILEPYTKTAGLLDRDDFADLAAQLLIEIFAEDDAITDAVAYGP